MSHKLSTPLGSALTVLPASASTVTFNVVPASVLSLSAGAVGEAAVQVSRVADRFGDAGRAGWSPLPDVLLFNQHKLGIGSEDLNVLLNLLAHYYSPGGMPFVRPNIIAKRMGVSTRSVQRSITRLRKMGLLGKLQGPKRQVVHDLQPLLEKLQPLARDRIADKEARRAIAQQQGEVPQLT